MFVQPVWLGWGGKHYDVSAGYGFYAPAGEDNIGLGFWTHQVQAAGAWYPFDNRGTAVTVGRIEEIMNETHSGGVRYRNGGAPMRAGSGGRGADGDLQGHGVIHGAPGADALSERRGRCTRDQRNRATIEPSKPGFIDGDCAGLGYLAVDGKYSVDTYCTFAETGEDAFDIRAKVDENGGSVEVIGGSGKWSGATGSGKLKSKWHEGARGSYTYEFTITTP